MPFGPRTLSLMTNGVSAWLGCVSLSAVTRMPLAMIRIYMLHRTSADRTLAYHR
jgi:hypothetical protein